MKLKFKGHVTDLVLYFPEVGRIKASEAKIAGLLVPTSEAPKMLPPEMQLSSIFH